MRTCLLILLLSLMPTWASAEPCAYLESRRPPLIVKERLIRLHRGYECDANTDGRLAIRFYRSEDGKRTLAKSKEITLKPRSGRRRTLNFSEIINAKDYCGTPSNSRKPGRLVGLGTRQRLIQSQEVFVEVEGTGALKDLNWTSKIEVTCPKCSIKKRKSMRIQHRGQMVSRLHPKKQTDLYARVSNDWFECARADSWIDFRLFDKRDGKTSDAIRPAFVLKDLQKKFTLKGSERELSVRIPFKKVCQSVG